MMTNRSMFRGSFPVCSLAAALLLAGAARVEAAGSVSVTVEEEKGIGVGFDQISEESQTLTIKLTAPGQWDIQSSKRRYNAGVAIWMPAENNTRAKTHTYIVEGVIPDEGHAAAFEGELAKDMEGEGDPPAFDVAVADLDVDLPGAEDETEGEETGGLLLPPDAELTLDVAVRAEWTKLKKGPEPVHLGQVEFTVTGTGAAQIEIYDPDGTKLYPVQGTSRPVQIPSDQKHYAAEYTIKTGAAFAGSATIEATFTWDGDIKADSTYTAKDVVRLMPITVDFVRLWNVFRPAIRATRAIDSALRHAKTYEDSERPPSIEGDDDPILILGAAHATMHETKLALKCQFSPPEAGTQVLWKLDAGTKGAVIGPTSGDFADDSVQNITLEPSFDELQSHEGHDFLMRVGVDRNGDGVLSDDEAFSLDFRVRLIGKAEHDYCMSQFSWTRRQVARLLYPNSTDCLEAFLQVAAPYNTSESVMIPFSYGAASYNQVRGMGSNPIGITEGMCRRCTWSACSAFALQVVSDSKFSERFVKEVISHAQPDIDAFYLANPGETSHTFNYNRTHTYGPACVDLFNSVGVTTVHATVQLDTARAATPEITGIAIVGNLTDLYDFDYDGDDQANGWGARIQTCYEPAHGRNAGFIYKMQVLLDHETKGTAFPSLPYTDVNDIAAYWAFYCIAR